MKILIVEDDPEEMEKAVSVIGDQAEVVKATVRYPTAALAMDNVDGILTDLMFPEDRNTEPSLNGLVIAISAQNAGIPCVICTSEHGHGANAVCATKIQGLLELPEIVKTSSFEEQKGKNWQKAFEELKRQIECNQTL